MALWVGGTPPEDMPPGLYYRHLDHLGGLHVLTNATGVEQLRLTYYPFGEPRTDAGPFLFDWHRFTGQALDSTTQLYDYGARYYNPALGRFLSPDTIVPDPGNLQSLNRYSYVRNNPLSRIDPTGHLDEGAEDAYGRVLPPWQVEAAPKIEASPQFNPGAVVPDVIVYTGEQLTFSGLVRGVYDGIVLGGDPDSEIYRKKLKQVTREATPDIVRGPLQAIRPGTDKREGSVGHANRTNETATRLGAMFRVVGPFMMMLGLAEDVRQVLTSENTYRTLAEVSGGTIGGILGGIGGAALGMELVPGPGAVVGGLWGATSGGALGRNGSIWLFDQLVVR